MKQSDIDRLKNIALSDKDVLKLVEGKARIVLYSELHKYKSLDQLLEPHGAIFLLYEAKPNYGHWVAVFKQDKNTIEYFDPYGLSIDSPLQWIPTSFRKVSNQWYPQLTSLFYHSKYKNLIWNEHKFQHKGSNIKTCGRWSATRIVFRNMPLEEFAKLFKGSNSDDIISLITSEDLNY